MTRRTGKSRKIVSAILAIALMFACVGGISAIAAIKTKNISPTEFTRGNLNSYGEYVSDNTSIYTKNAFGCKGLTIQPDFEASLTYDVYFYDADNELVDTRLGLKKAFEEATIPMYVTCRIVIHPIVPEDVKPSEFKINIWEIYGYASQLRITVDKDQNVEYSDNLYNATKVIGSKTVWDEQNEKYDINGCVKTGSKATEFITVSGEYDQYAIYIRFVEPATADFHVIIADDDGKIFEAESVTLIDKYDEAGSLSGWVKLMIDVPRLTDYENVYLRVSMPTDAQCYIVGCND